MSTLDQLGASSWTMRFIPALNGGAGEGVELEEVDTKQRIYLPPIDALEVLEVLRASNEWEEQGLVVPIPSKPRPGAKFKFVLLNEPAVLAPGQARELFHLLEIHEASLRETAEPILKQQGEALMRVYAYLFGVMRAKKLSQLDLTNRPLPWLKEENVDLSTPGAPWKEEIGTRVLTCNLAPNRVTIYSTPS